MSSPRKKNGSISVTVISHQSKWHISILLEQAHNGVGVECLCVGPVALSGVFLRHGEYSGVAVAS